jgi:hypothetical protein
MVTPLRGVALGPELPFSLRRYVALRAFKAAVQELTGIAIG